jgi:KUP system potassium uptake protein
LGQDSARAGSDGLGPTRPWRRLRDIGTSPIYALKASFDPAYGLTPTPSDVYGVLSLIIWALTTTVSVQYVGVIMRSNNNGEGGFLALLAIIPRRRTASSSSAPW